MKARFKTNEKSNGTCEVGPMKEGWTYGGLRSHQQMPGFGSTTLFEAPGPTGPIPVPGVGAVLPGGRWDPADSREGAGSGSGSGSGWALLGPAALWLRRAERPRGAPQPPPAHCSRPPAPRRGDETPPQPWPGRRREHQHSRQMEPAQRREWDGVPGGSLPSSVAEGGEGCLGVRARRDLEVMEVWPAGTCCAHPKCGQAAARGRRPEGPEAQREPPKPGPRVLWNPKLHSALMAWPQGRDHPRAPKPRGPYRSRLASHSWLLPQEAAGAPSSPPEHQPEDTLLLIDAQGVPYTVSRRDMEAGPAPAPRQAHCCPVCLRAFLYLSDLERHRISHSEHKPHLCRACGKTFKRASHLQRHRHIHTGQRPFRCAVCQKGFRESGELLRHQRVHTGEKPYQCPLCRLRFTERNTLRRHAKRKHAHEACGQGAGGEGRPGWAAEDGQELGGGAGTP
ncbi:uncharacterized protein LOC142025276 [Carettochelys insculpta]|uniref:uncharacterized protein LOC142025276 n=1 Tax=Carettochelys insculpta TaxID=44489 RepID=UPI003EC0628F